MTPPNPKVTAPERETDEQRATRISSQFTGIPNYERAIYAILEAQRLAREDEREQCAKLADEEGAVPQEEGGNIVRADACDNVARAIRSRQPGGANHA